MDTWRLSFWIGLAYSGACFLGVLFGMPETNAGIILDKRAKMIRKTKNSSIPHGPHDGDAFIWQDLVTKVLVRPVTMLHREPLVFFTCIYLAFQYAILYIFLQSYPIIFEGMLPLTSEHHMLTRL